FREQAFGKCDVVARSAQFVGNGFQPAGCLVHQIVEIVQRRIALVERALVSPHAAFDEAQSFYSILHGTHAGSEESGFILRTDRVVEATEDLAEDRGIELREELAIFGGMAISVQKDVAVSVQL